MVLGMDPFIPRPDGSLHTRRQELETLLDFMLVPYCARWQRQVA